MTNQSEAEEYESLAPAEPICLHETSDFEVEIVTLKLGDWKGLEGYGVFNKRTSVREAEVTVEYAAIRTMRTLQQELSAALEDTEGYPSEPNMEDDFGDVLTRLAEQHRD